MEKELQEFALSLGVDPETATAEQVENLEKMRQLQLASAVAPGMKAPGGQPRTFAEMAADESRELTRREGIEGIAMTAMRENPVYHDQIVRATNEALEDRSQTIEGFELTLLRNLRQVQGAFTTPQGSRKRDPHVMECALMWSSMGQSRAEKAYGEDVCQAVEDNGLRGYTLQQAMFEAAAARGVRFRAGERIHAGNIEQVFHAAFAKGPQQGFQMAGQWSTIDLPGILGAVAYKSLLQGYMEADNSWRRIADVKSTTNFHVQNHYRMLDDVEFELVPPSGRIPHGTLSQEGYTSQARTYGKMLGINRTDIINDDLGAFDNIRRRLGMGGAKKFNNLVWSVFMNNANHYTAAKGNYIEGADSALDLNGTGLKNALLAYRTQRSPEADGQKWVSASLSPPTGLLVPPELEDTADRIYESRNLVSGADVTPGTPDSNIHRNKYEPIVQPRLSDSAFTGNSALAWYLLGEALFPVVVTFLNGQETPIVESAQADFNVLGVNFRGYFDFGADLAEYLGSVKSKGEA